MITTITIIITITKVKRIDIIQPMAIFNETTLGTYGHNECDHDTQSARGNHHYLILT